MFFVSSLSSISRVRRTTMWSLESILKKSYPHQIRQKWANHDIGKVYPLFIFKKNFICCRALCASYLKTTCDSRYIYKKI